MSKIKELGKKIEKTLESGDITSKTEIHQDSKPAKKQYSKKKMTFYLEKDSEAKFNEIFARRLMRNQKTDKSTLIAEAIDKLYSSEKDYAISRG
jgi:hypothetical protein